MTSQGQRFRRRALRRGYKVDEVDAFLDRVEAMLAGRPVETPVTAQEVHDIVFRVRFGGYDEWQVDLHLDRVERQVAELEERGGHAARGPEQRMTPPMQEMPPMDRMGPPPVSPAGPPPFRDERLAPPVAARPVSPMAAPAGPPPMAPPPMASPPMAPPPVAPPPMAPPPMAPPPMAPPPVPGAARYDEPTFAGFEPVRHARPDMTAEMHLGVEPPRAMPPGAPPMGAPLPGAAPFNDIQRVDQLRRSFQPRRFGSGYDPAQVDRVFEAVIAAMSGRTGVPISDAELDPSQFNLVSGGYFEAEVEAALREVRDILRRR